MTDPAAPSRNTDGIKAMAMAAEVPREIHAAMFAAVKAGQKPTRVRLDPQRYAVAVKVAHARGAATLFGLELVRDETEGVTVE